MISNALSGTAPSFTYLTVTQPVVNATAPTPVATLTGGAHTALPAGVEAIDVNVNLARTADAPIYVSITAGVLTNIEAGDNIGISKQTATTGGSFTNVAGTTSNGPLYRNFMQTLTTTDVLYTTTVGIAAFENYVSGVIGASGYIIPARDS